MEKPLTAHTPTNMLLGKAWLWPSAKIKLVKTRQVMISPHQQIIAPIKSYRLSCFTLMVIIQQLACPGDSTFPSEGKEEGKQGTKGCCRISGELTHKEIAVSSLAPNKSNFETHETL